MACMGIGRMGLMWETEVTEEPKQKKKVLTDPMLCCMRWPNGWRHRRMLGDWAEAGMDD